MLTQEHSIELDSVGHIYPNHLKAIDAAAKLVETSADFTWNDMYLQTPHVVQSLLNSELTQHFSANLGTSYEIPCFHHLILNIEMSLNLLQLLLLLEKSEPHDCEVMASYFVRPRPGLQDIHLTDPDLMLVGHTVEKGN